MRRTEDELVLAFPWRAVRSGHQTAEFHGQVHRTGTRSVPVPGADVEARHLAGRELRHAGVESAGPHRSGSGKLTLERQIVVDEPAVDIEGGVVFLASAEVDDGEALAVGRAVLIGAAEKK